MNEECAKGYTILVMTQTWPGSWGKGTTLKKALDRLKSEMGSESFKRDRKLVVGFIADKDIIVDQLGRWSIPKNGHEPIKLGNV